MGEFRVRFSVGPPPSFAKASEDLLDIESSDRVGGGRILPVLLFGGRMVRLLVLTLPRLSDINSSNDCGFFVTFKLRKPSS